MGGLCTTVTNFAGYFIILAFVVALAETALALWAKFQASRITPQADAKFAPDPEGLAKLLDALSKLLSTLKDLPYWIAILLAGLALTWIAASATTVCKVGVPPAKAAAATK